MSGGGGKDPPDKPDSEGMLVDIDNESDNNSEYETLAELRKKIIGIDRERLVDDNRAINTSENCCNNQSNNVNSESNIASNREDCNSNSTNVINQGNTTSLKTAASDNGDKNNSKETASVSAGNFYDFENRYRHTDKGPFYVYIEHKNKSLGRLFPVRIGHYILPNKSIASNIIDIKSIGINRVKVILKTYIAANKLVTCDSIKNNNLVAYIPRFFTQKKGVIKMVDTYFSEEYLKSAIQSDIEVVSVKRMERRVVNDRGESSFVPRQVIIVTFLGSNLPTDVQINLTNFPVEPYVHPVVQCFSCMRYGHTSKMCKGTRRCRGCGGDHQSDECDGELCCIYCNSKEHNATSRVCPEFKKQLSIKKTMAVENISFSEAQRLVNNPSYSKITTNNRYALLSDLKNFPPLPENVNTAPDFPTPKQNAGHSIRRPGNQIQTSITKKRKAVKSPERRNHDFDPNVVAPSSSILPNPHRNDFIVHKEKLIEQITVLFISLLKNIIPESNVDQIDSELNIKQHLSSIFVNLNQTNNAPPCEAN